MLHHACKCVAGVCVTDADSGVLALLGHTTHRGQVLLPHTTTPPAGEESRGRVRALGGEGKGEDDTRKTVCVATVDVVSAGKGEKGKLNYITDELHIWLLCVLDRV